MKKNMTGVQACVESIFTTLDIDKKNGLKTGAIISGYRGSPLGGFDKTVQADKRTSERDDVVFIKGLNEELAFAAVAGSQHLNAFGSRKEVCADGAVGFWYAKGPGVDRSMDAIHHFAYQGSTRYGGVVMFCGDDHTCSSSTMPHQTSQTLASVYIPTLAPSSVEEIIEFAVKGIWLCRLTGCYTAIKITSDLADAYQTVDLERLLARLETFDFSLFENVPENVFYDYHIHQGAQLEKKVSLRLAILPQAIKLLDLFKIYGNSDSKLGIVAVGRIFHEVSNVVKEYGLEDRVEILKVGCVWPIPSDIITDFCRNKEKIIIVEEKDPFVENQIKTILFENKVNTKVFGKGIFKFELGLTRQDVVDGLIKLGLVSEKDPSEKLIDYVGTTIQHRIPYYCGGCPHNTGTKLPHGSMALLGIGCHYLAVFMPDRPTYTVCPMGLEGGNWIGARYFSKRRHVFVNLGDGTYFHSGILAIRFAVATNTNCTFKILYNQAVAMTGGQEIDGKLTLEDLILQVIAEGVKTVYLVTHYYDTRKTHSIKRLASFFKDVKIVVYPKDKIIDAQEELRKKKGVSVLIYDQECATEKRRKEKRKGKPGKKTVIEINPDICDACGDCQKKSNCLAVCVDTENKYLPVRYINQSSCNLDKSCTEGFCPSFIEYEKDNVDDYSAALETILKTNIPTEKVGSPDHIGVIIFGVGGTGTSTLTKTVSDALELQGYTIYSKDKTGMAQRFGEVIGRVEAVKNGYPTIERYDYALILDLNTFLSNLDLITKDTVLIANSDIFNLPETVISGDAQKYGELLKIFESLPNKKYIVPFAKLSEKFFGTCIVMNMMVLGYAKEIGLPLEASSVEKVLAGNSKTLNLMAFTFGRCLVYNNAEKLLGIRRVTFEDHVQAMRNLLVDYGCDAKSLSVFDSALKFVAENVENRADRFNVINALVDLLYVKDEYEVARLWLRFLKDKGIDRGRIFLGFRNRKVRIPVSVAKVMFEIVSRMRFLRGSMFDIHRVRNKEDLNFRTKALAKFVELLKKGDTDSLVKLSEKVRKVRGYGYVRKENLEKVREI